MNTLGTLLVHVDASPRSRIRLAVAQQIALRCDTGSQAPGAIEAVCCTMPSFADLPLAYAEGAAAARSFLLELYAQRRAQARAAFDAFNLEAARPMSWVELAHEQAVPAVAGRALYADLLVLGQHMPEDLDTLNTPADFVEAVLFDSGRPAVIVPHAWSPVSIGREILIAWKPSREAARALGAALPLLQRASRIHYVVEHHAEAHGRQLEAWLRAHGAEAHIVRHAPLSLATPGEDLLSRAADADADLLVMGCYGHTRTRELLLGGVTRTVLQSMTLPVLMAH